MNIKDYVDIKISEETDGNMSSIHAGEETAVRNRKLFFKKYALDYNSLVYMSVDINSNFRIIDKHIVLGADEKVNGLITKNPELILGLVVADCAPVVLFDKENKVLALLHCGMMNIENRILECAISSMNKEFNTNPGDILVYIGPSIRVESYKYDKNIFSKLREDSEVRKTLIHHPEEKLEYSIDIVQAIKNILTQKGVKEENILDSGINTYTDPRYPSHVYTVEHNLPEFRFLTIAKIK